MTLPASLSSLPPPPPVTAAELVQHRDVAHVMQVHSGERGLERSISHPRVQKSGLVLAGHSKGIVGTRVQVLGETEISFLESLDPPTRRKRVEDFFALELSCVIVTRGVAPLTELVDAADRTDTPLVVSRTRSSETINAVHRVLDRLLAPTSVVHGVLVDVHAIGMLLLGPSSIGKSECALFLVERGHRLVADDQVQLTLLPNGNVVGAPPPLLRHHLEVRGIGILNIRDLFGATAVRDETVVDLIVELCPWRDDETYERLGLDDLSFELLGTPITMLRIPVRPGRDMGVILEVAARNQMLKRTGHHAARNFARALEKSLHVPHVETAPIERRKENDPA